MSEQTSEILQGTRPPGVSLSRINDILRRVGIALVVSVNTNENGKLTGKCTRFWLERAKSYDKRTTHN